MSQPDITDATAEISPLSAPLVPEGGAATTPSGAPDPYLAMIERAARDPAVDLAKLQGLMAMKKEVEADRASIAFAEAFIELQQDLPSIDRKGRIVVYSKALRERAEKEGPQVFEGQEPQQKTPYAQLDDILEAIREPLHKHGFSLRFEHDAPAAGDSYRIITTAILRHRQGHEEKASSPPLQHDSTGSKNNVQAVGSAMKYGRRYALMAVLPIVSHAPQDADDDGKAAGAALIDGDQLVAVQELLNETQSDLTMFFDTLGATGFSDLTVTQWKRGVSLLNEKKRRAAKKAATP
jgi:ERF superfamily